MLEERPAPHESHPVTRLATPDTREATGTSAARRTPGEVGEAPFFPAFSRRAERPRAPAEPPHLLLVGDSHAASPALAMPLRNALRTAGRYGGLGILNLDPNVKSFLNGVRVSPSAGWVVSNVLKPRPGVAYGVTGRTFVSTAARQSIGIEVADIADAFDSLIVCAGALPGRRAGFSLRAGDAQMEAYLTGPECREFVFPTPRQSFELTALGTDLSVYSLGVFSAPAKTVISSIGISGAQLKHFSVLSDAVAAAEFPAYGIDSLALMFGTNEAFNANLDGVAYREQAEQQIERWRRLSRQVPMALVGVPRVATAKTALLREGVPARYCGRGTGKDRTFVPPNWASVHQAQVEMAARLGLRHLDLARIMGDECAAEAWATATPPLMRADRVHFTFDGGEALGAALFRFLSP